MGIIEIGYVGVYMMQESVAGCLDMIVSVTQKGSPLIRRETFVNLKRILLHGMSCTFLGR